MRLQAKHRFPGRAEDVVAVLTDPSFHQELALPDLRVLEVLDHEDGPHDTRLVLRYEFVGTLDPMVKRLLGHRRLTWRQELTVDRPALDGLLTFTLEADPGRLRGAARLAFVDDGGGSRRALDGDVRVAVPLVGAPAERRIAAGFLRRLDIEAEQVTARLAAREER